MTTYSVKPLGCDPQKIKGMSEKLIVSHYENNYGGAVKRLNLIAEQLAGLDFNVAPGYLVNGLKREQLIATNSMILHELFFDGLGEESEPDARLAAALARDFGSYERWRSEFLAIGNWRLPRPALLAEMAQDQIAQDDEAEDGDGGSGPDIEANQRVAG